MKFLYFIGFILISQFCIAQSKEADFTLRSTMPTVTNDFTEAQREKMGSKITQIINKTNQATVGFYNDFYVFSQLTVEESGEIEGGMQNMTVTTIELALFVRQYSTNKVFNSMTKKLKGSGENKAQSISDAINKIKIIDDSYSKFISEAREKIIQYYNSNCGEIMKTAAKYVTAKDYEQAVCILESIPVSASCHDEAQKKSIEAYLKYLDANCAKNINYAKTEIAAHNYANAVDALELIDPSSSCKKEADKLIEELAKKVDIKVKKQEELTKLRIEAVKEIAKSYYSNKATVIIK